MAQTLHAIDETARLAERVYQRLKDAITDGALAPGMRLRQAELADDLGVSRAPVSHALHLLKHQGLVRESGRRGVEITPMDLDHVRNIYQLRTSLDSLAARLLAERIAAGRAPADAPERLETSLKAAEAFDVTTPLTARVRADMAFHQEIHSLCGNPAISEALDPLWPHIGRAMNTVLSASDVRTRAWEEHAAIAGLILAGDPDGAAAAAWEHSARAGRETEERLRRQVSARSCA
jgi:DNA-binding GntR family transcriptional regulator